MFARDPIATPSSLPISVRAAIAGASPARARSTRTRRLRALSVQLGRSPIGREARGHGLEVPVAVAASLAGLTAGDDDDMPELGPPAIEVVVDHDAAADTGAEREHDQVGRVSPGAEPPLRECGSIAVVFDAGRETVAFAGAIGEMHPVYRNVRRPECDPRSAVDVERNPVADRNGAVREEVIDDADRPQPVPPPASRPGWESRSCDLSCRRARRVRQGFSSHRGRLRSRLPHARRRYDNRTDARGREALPGVQGRSGKGTGPSAASGDDIAARGLRQPTRRLVGPGSATSDAGSPWRSRSSSSSASSGSSRATCRSHTESRKRTAVSLRRSSVSSPTRTGC